MTVYNECGQSSRSAEIVAVRWAAVLLRIREVLGSNLDRDTAHHITLSSHGFPQALQVYSGRVPRLRHDRFILILSN